VRLTWLEGRLFFGCHQLSSCVFPNHLDTVSDMVFMRSGLRFVELPASLHTLSPLAFAGCEHLRGADFGKCAQLRMKYGGRVFLGCHQLSELVLPVQVKLSTQDEMYMDRVAVKTDLAVVQQAGPQK